VVLCTPMGAAVMLFFFGVLNFHKPGFTINAKPTSMQPQVYERGVLPTSHNNFFSRTRSRSRESTAHIRGHILVSIPRGTRSGEAVAKIEAR